MMKRINKLALVLTIFSCLLWLGTGSRCQAAGASRMVNTAGTLTEAECSVVNSKLDMVSSDLAFDVVVAYVEGSGSGNIQSMAEDYFFDHGYGQGSDRDGAILLVDMNMREWAVYVNGFGRTAFNDAAYTTITNAVSTKLSNQDYQGAAIAFADQCSAIVSTARSGKDYKPPFKWGMSAIISFVVSFLGGSVYVGGMKAQLKTVHSQAGARQYVKKDSLKLTESTEKFLYKSVKTTKKTTTENSGAAAGSSGTSGKF